MNNIKNGIARIVQWTLGILALFAFPVITYSLWPAEMHAHNPDLELIVGIQYLLKCIGACVIGYAPLYIVSIYDPKSW